MKSEERIKIFKRNCEIILKHYPRNRVAKWQLSTLNWVLENEELK